MATRNDILSTDVLHYECVPLDRLDEAFMVLSPGKGGRLPQTCLPDDVERTPDVLAEVLGHEPTAEQWATFSYKWFREFDPDRVLFVPLDPPPTLAAVPLPDGLGLLIGGLSVLILMALWKWCDDLSDGNVG